MKANEKDQGISVPKTSSTQYDAPSVVWLCQSLGRLSTNTVAASTRQRQGHQDRLHIPGRGVTRAFDVTTIQMEFKAMCSGSEHKPTLAFCHANALA